jgi:hypothetical protein
LKEIEPILLDLSRLYKEAGALDLPKPVSTSVTNDTSIGLPSGGT